MVKIIKHGNDIVLDGVESFDLAQTLDCGQAFRFSRDADGVWSGVAFGHVIRAVQKNDKIIFYNMDKKIFENIFFEYFTLDVDYQNIKKRLCTDKTMQKAIEYAGGIRLLRQETFETLINFIISQNNNIPRIKGIIDRLCRNFGKSLGGGFYSFPEACVLAKLNENDFDVLKAGFRTAYILDAAKKVSGGDVCLNSLKCMEIGKAREYLQQIRGVGPKVAECVLLYGCGRFEAFPVDVWIKRVLDNLYPAGLPNVFGEHAGIAQQYLFHWIRNAHKNYTGQRR